MRVDASAPTRIDLAGGTLDIWPIYLFHPGAQTLNVAITRRAECRLTARDDDRLRVVVEDTGVTAEVDAPSQLDDRPELRLVSRLCQFFEVTGVTVTTRSGSPVGAGLAGSSALAVALGAALARWRRMELSAEALMRLVLDLEAQVIAVPTGVQDYRPAVYGGVAAIELGPGAVTRVPLPVDVDALSDRLVLFYTGQSRLSGTNNWTITRRRLDGDPDTIALLDALRDVARAMRGALAAERWAEVGRWLREEWTLRKRLAPGVTTVRLDGIVACGLNAGAYAAKVCGAGGGGCVVFLAPPDATAVLRRAVTEAGAEWLDCRVDTEGLRVA